MGPDLERQFVGTRRHLLQTAGLGVGAMALQALLARDGRGAEIERGAEVGSAGRPLSPKSPMLAPRAKRVIYLHMAGSPSQLELFEHKPDLRALHMQDCPLSTPSSVFVIASCRVMADSP